MGENKHSITNILTFIGFPLVFIAIFVTILLYFNQFSQIFLDPDALKTWVGSWGITAPLIFIGVQVIQVVIFVIPGEVPQIAAGYLFGIGPGVMYSITGILIGSALNFFLARWLGIPFIKKIMHENKLQKMYEFAEKPRFQIILFVFFLIPGIPKDALTYVAGLSPISFVSFLIISGAGRLPGIIGSAMIGNAAASKNWVLVIVISVGATILFFTGYFFKEKIYLWLKHIIRHDE
jgi:uncharacterized membrane protein YdjX (TVP38/TMEM64 family)